MTWTCPYCNREHPNDNIGVPRKHDTKEGCKVCWISPPGTVRYQRPDSVTIQDKL